jgi:hypothetical protein
MKRFASALCILGIAVLWPAPLPAQTTPTASRTSKIILDTDIGDDIDDAFALALALRSPEIEVIGITTAWGDTSLRAKLANRLLKEVGTRPIPVRAGLPTLSKSNFTQNQWASAGAAAPASPDAVEFLLEQAKKSPGEITLVAIGPLTNLGAAIDRDADGFRKFQARGSHGRLHPARIWRFGLRPGPGAGAGIQHLLRREGSPETLGKRRTDLHDAARFDTTVAR